MPKQGDCTLTNLASVTQGGDPSGAKVEVVISNLTDDEIAENAMTISFHAVAMDNQTQSSAVESFYVAAIAAMGSHTSSSPLQIDPGNKEAKLGTARFYMQRMLPRHSTHFANVMAGGGSIMAFADAAF